MGQRLQLQTLLESILDMENVYFQPPTGMQMKYPALVYALSTVDSRFADNRPYKHAKRYSVTYIDLDPDSDVPDKIAELPMCSFSRRFVADNLNHTVFELYF